MSPRRRSDPGGPEVARAYKILQDRAKTDGIPAIREEVWELQRRCFDLLQRGDTSVAGPLLSASRLSFAAEAMIGQALVATASAVVFSTALHALELAFAQRSEPFPEPLRREVQWMVERCIYVAHRSGVPFAGCLLAEGLTNRRFGDRMIHREMSAVLARPDPRAELRDIRRAVRQLASPVEDPSQAAGSAQGLSQRVHAMFLDDLDRFDRASPRAYLTTASTIVHSVHGARSTGRSVIYLVPGPTGGAAIRLEAPAAGRELCRSVELPELSLDVVQAQVRGLRTALAVTPALVKDRVHAVRAMLEETTRVVWDPLLAAWPDLYGTGVALVPLGECALLPLYTAPVDDVPACGRMDLTVVPSGRALMLAGSWPAADAADVFVTADPWFGNNKIRMAVHEAKNVAAVHGVKPLILRELDDAALEPEPSQADPGARQFHPPTTTLQAPTTAHLVDSVARAGLVHIACHGDIDNTTPLASTLKLGEPITIATLLEHDLRPGATVVLSSCHLGGIGTELSGEQLGFPAALLAMGARSVIGALWPLPDSAETAELITELHRELVGESDTPKQEGAQGAPGSNRFGQLKPSVALGQVIAQAAREGLRPTVWAPLSHFGA